MLTGSFEGRCKNLMARKEPLFRIKIIPWTTALTPRKLALIQKAAYEQLQPWEYNELLHVAEEFKAHGSTPWVKAKLGQLMTKVHWGHELGESPAYEKALIEADKAFSLKTLKKKSSALGLSIGPKKEMCHKLYNAFDPDVVAVMEPFLKSIPLLIAEGIKKNG